MENTKKHDLILEAYDLLSDVTPKKYDCGRSTIVTALMDKDCANLLIHHVFEGFDAGHFLFGIKFPF